MKYIYIRLEKKCEKSIIIGVKKWLRNSNKLYINTHVSLEETGISVEWS